jgi:RNA polymerase sigma factor (sigma-70 family)
MTEATDSSSTELSASALVVLLDNRARFFNFLAGRVGSADIAEEILQEALTKAVERGGQVHDEESVVAWFFRLLRNAVTDLYRRREAADRGLKQFAQEVETAAGSDELMREVCECVSGVLETLKPEYQASIRAVDLDGRELRAFALETGITPNNAAVRLHRAREALARRLKETCGACAEHGCVDCTCGHRGMG